MPSIILRTVPHFILLKYLWGYLVARGKGHVFKVQRGHLCALRFNLLRRYFETLTNLYIQTISSKNTFFIYLFYKQDIQDLFSSFVPHTPNYYLLQEKIKKF